jgi:uncharacterized protein (TIGR02646 family)
MSDGGPGGRRRLGDRQEYEQTAAVPASFPPHWIKADVKGLLHAMQGRICAYCGDTNELDVEHFRPKGAVDGDRAHGGYWWLAYECSNYLLGCTICNRTRKKASFPLLPNATRCAYNTRDTIAKEGRVLLDPTEDPVEEWLTIGPDDVTGRLIPNPGLSPGERSRVQDSIDLFGLNLPPVRTQRSEAYERAARAAAEQRWGDLRSSAMKHRPHSLAAKIILHRVAPEHLPSAAEEMVDLLNSLWRDLLTLIRELRSLRARGKLIRPVDQGQLHVLGWALVILQADPPAGDPAAAEAHLGELLEREETEIKTQIVELFRVLAEMARGV